MGVRAHLHLRLTASTGCGLSSDQNDAGGLHGGAGNDNIHGGGEGKQGPNVFGGNLYGGRGNDNVFGKGGNDFLYGGRASSY